MKTTLNGMSRYFLASGITKALADAKQQATQAAIESVYQTLPQEKCVAGDRYHETLNEVLDHYIPWAIDYAKHNLPPEYLEQYMDGLITKEAFLFNVSLWLYERVDLD